MCENKLTDMTPRMRWVLVAILCTSLVLNVVSLLIPFSEVRAGSRHSAFTLMRTATLLWNKGFHLLSVLAIGFSVCFPFVKLGILGSIAAGLPTTARALPSQSDTPRPAAVCPNVRHRQQESCSGMGTRQAHRRRRGTCRHDLTRPRA